MLLTLKYELSNLSQSFVQEEPPGFPGPLMVYEVFSLPKPDLLGLARPIVCAPGRTNRVNDTGEGLNIWDLTPVTAATRNIHSSSFITASGHSSSDIFPAQCRNVVLISMMAHADCRMQTQLLICMSLPRNCWAHAYVFVVPTQGSLRESNA